MIDSGVEQRKIIFRAYFVKVTKNNATVNLPTLLNWNNVGKPSRVLAGLKKETS